MERQTILRITHIGKRPTVDNQTDISIETHILNFDGDLYGQKIDVQLYQRLRRIQKFDDFSRLSEQIKQDCLFAQSFWEIQQDAISFTMDAKTHDVIIDNQSIYLSVKRNSMSYISCIPIRKPHLQKPRFMNLFGMNRAIIAAML